MSFYLLPPVSYQTQQKMKSQAHDRKHKSHSRSRKHSVASTTSSASVVTKSTTSHSIDELSNLDVVSIGSDKSKASTVSNSTSSRKKLLHTYNYNFNTEINEIIKSSSKHGHSRRRSHTSRETESSIKEVDSSAASTASRSTSSGNPLKADFSLHQNDSQNTVVNSPVLPTSFASRSHELGIIDDEDETILEAETNELTRVYSDVLSIFSTRCSSGPFDTPSVSASLSIKTKLKKKFFDSTTN